VCVYVCVCICVLITVCMAQARICSPPSATGRTQNSSRPSTGSREAMLVMLNIALLRALHALPCLNQISAVFFCTLTVVCRCVCCTGAPDGGDNSPDRMSTGGHTLHVVKPRTDVTLPSLFSEEAMNEYHQNQSDLHRVSEGDEAHRAHAQSVSQSRTVVVQPVPPAGKVLYWDQIMSQLLCSSGQMCWCCNVASIFCI